MNTSKAREYLGMCPGILMMFSEQNERYDKLCVCTVLTPTVAAGEMGGDNRKSSKVRKKGAKHIELINNSMNYIYNFNNTVNYLTAVVEKW